MEPVRDRSAAIRAGVGLPLLVVVVALVTAAGAIITVAVRGGRPVSAAAVRSADASTPRSPVPAAPAGASTRGVAETAAAYRYPLGCLGITLSADRSSMLGRHSPCWRYGVYVTAVLHRVNGTWRLMLEATSAKCPTVSLPDIVRSALVTCERAAAPGPSG